MDDGTIEAPLSAKVFDIMPMPALVVDRAGTILLVNRAMAQKVENRCGSLVGSGQTLGDMFARDAEYLMTDLRTAASGGRLITWLRNAVEDASGRMCFRVVAISQGPGRAGQYLLIEDRAKTFSRVFNELNVRLRRAHEEAAEAHRKHRQLKENYRVLEQFSLVAAHDLKAPLLNIALLLEFLQEEYGAILDGPAQDLLVAAKESATRLQRLISALLTHARSGAKDLKIRAIDVAESVETVRKLLAAELREADGEIRVIGSLGKVQADPDQFDQLLQNLISNSLKYRTTSRSPVIRIERVTEPGQSDRLVISDNGRGFDPTEKDRLFEPFKRLHSGAEISGSGVGLSICKTVCERHGWSIDATGIPDVGASFEISGLDRRSK